MHSIFSEKKARIIFFGNYLKFKNGVTFAIIIAIFPEAPNLGKKLNWSSKIIKSSEKKLVSFGGLRF